MTDANARIALDPALRARHRAALSAATPDHIARLSWSRQRIEEFQRDGLRRLLRHAKSNSPFHAARLADVAPDSFELADLPRLPAMTKSTMMARFDDVVTDRRLTRARVEAHLAATRDEPGHLLDEYMVLASGGSSGERGIFVYGWDAAVDYMLGLSRSALARLAASGLPAASGIPLALVAAGSGVHATRALTAIFAGAPIDVHSIPVTLPLAEIVARLNALQPLLLQSYASSLAMLAEEQRAGRLRIHPMSVTSTSEFFTPELRARVEAAFGVPATDQLGSSEGILGTSAPGDPAIVLADDLFIVEPVDDVGRPVPPGVPSAKVLITSLMNPTQPLIRYELTDRFVRQPDAPTDGHMRVTLEGRQDDLLVYGNVVIHPLVVRSALVRTAAVIEYQVRQTRHGVDVAVVATDRVDAGALARAIADQLSAAGLPKPEVTVRLIAALPRHPETGKTKRFVTLPPA